MVSKPHSIHRHLILVLVVCLLAGAGCGRTPVDQRDLTTLLPGEPSSVIFADIPALQGSETWRELQELWPGGIDVQADLEQFLEDAGIDREKDLGRLQGALYSDNAPEGWFAAVLTGRFNLDALRPELEKRGFTAEIHRELNLFRPPTGSDAGGGVSPRFRWHLVYLDDTAIGLADTRMGATGLIDGLLDDGESLDRHPGFGPLIAEADTTAPIWGVGLLSKEAAADLMTDLPVRNMLPAIENIAYSARFDSALQMHFTTLLPSPEEATRVAGQLNGLVQLSAGLLSMNPQWVENISEDPRVGRLVMDILENVSIVVEDHGVNMIIDTTPPPGEAAITSPG